MPGEQDRLRGGSMPAAYDRWLAPAVFRPFAVDFARRAARHAPRRVLEIAAGTGVLTRELVTVIPAAEVTATDLNAAMAGLGSRRVPGAAWQQGDALRLPFGDDQFDLVACQVGVMSFPDKPAAFREARRVLAPGGGLVFSTWGAVGTRGFAAALAAGIERAFPDDPPAFVAAVPPGYSGLGQVTADLAAGGPECVPAELVTFEGQAGSAADVAAGSCTGTPLRMAIEQRGDLMASTALISEEMRRRRGDGPVTATMTALVVEARPRAWPACPATAAAVAVMRLQVLASLFAACGQSARIYTSPGCRPRRPCPGQLCREPARQRPGPATGRPGERS